VEIAGHLLLLDGHFGAGGNPFRLGNLGLDTGHDFCRYAFGDLVYIVLNVHHKGRKAQYFALNTLLNGLGFTLKERQEFTKHCASKEWRDRHKLEPAEN
jgi:hypothetical protein